jgi:hypothetical protein
MNKRHPGRPKRIEWAQCKAQTCERSTKGGSKGFCFAHYMAMRRGYLTADGIWVITDPNRQRHESRHYLEICLVTHCDKPLKEMGMCSKHYQQLRTGIINEQGQKLRDFIKRPRKDKWIGRDGYVLVPAPEGHPKPRADGSILQHRLVMEQAIGRYLQEWEIVHHKNGNRQDNRIENLELMDGRSRHGAGHPPGSDIDLNASIQTLLQQENLPEELRTLLKSYQNDTRNLRR